MEPAARYRFAGFEVSTRERQIRRQGVVLPIIPRYFDLLVLLLGRRPGVVTRREIFDEVWRDVIVSDGALTQAVRTLRRTLGDDSREPQFIRTVSRHGYSFVWTDVDEVPDTGAPNGVSASGSAGGPTPVVPPEATIDGLVAMLLDDKAVSLPLEERRDLAQQLHGLGTAHALDALSLHPGNPQALALMRDTRWDVPGAGAVPFWGHPDGARAAIALVRFRVVDALGVISRRWAAAAAGGGGAGALAGVAGGALLWMAPASSAPPTAAVVLGVLGALAGAVAAAGVAAGIAVAEGVARSRRGVAILAGGALGGLATGVLASALGRWTLEGLFGLQVPIGGPLEGLCLGAAVAAGYAASTPRPGGGIAALAGRARATAALLSSVCSGVTALLLAWSGRALVGGTLHAVAQASAGSQMTLAPLGALLGEPAFGPVSQAMVAAFEGALFGLGLAWGLSIPVRRENGTANRSRS